MYMCMCMYILRLRPCRRPLHLQECRTTIVAGDWWLGTCFRDIWSHFGTTLEVFGWVLGTIGITLGAIGLL